MLSHLLIENYGLIDRVDISLPAGFSVITGETGAGKSMMLGALGMLAGARADSKSTSSAGKSVVEAVFTDPPVELKPIFEEASVEWDDAEAIVRREVSPGGRTRAFVNDSPVNLSTLSLVASRLIDIHSQHSNMRLGEPREQLRVLDAFAGNGELRSEYRQVFNEYIDVRRRISDYRQEVERHRENRDFLLFRLEQLDRLKPRRGELAEIEKRYEILSDAGEIKDSLSEAAGLLGGLETSALSRLADARAAIGRIDLTLLEEHSPDELSLSRRIESLYVELRDISETVEGYCADVHADPSQLERVSARMSQIYEACKRFKVDNDDQLVELRDDLRRQLDAIDGDSGDIEQLLSRKKELAARLADVADRLSATRREAADRFSEILVDKVHQLGLPNLRFSVMVTAGKYSVDGRDAVQFMCSFNKNQKLMPMGSVASGGEMSRLMLGIKSLMAGDMRLPTIIFDEIDTGVSGEIADRMGRMMGCMGDSMQVLAVTHLPQVAARGGTHFKVYKTDEAERTVTRVARLDSDARDLELAQMLAGPEITEAALANARSLIGAALADGRDIKRETDRE